MKVEEEEEEEGLTQPTALHIISSNFLPSQDGIIRVNIIQRTLHPRGPGHSYVGDTQIEPGTAVRSGVGSDGNANKDSLQGRLNERDGDFTTMAGPIYTVPPPAVAAAAGKSLLSSSNNYSRQPNEDQQFLSKILPHL